MVSGGHTAGLLESYISAAALAGMRRARALPGEPGAGEEQSLLRLAGLFTTGTARPPLLAMVAQCREELPSPG